MVTEIYMDGELHERCALRYDDWRTITSLTYDEQTQQFAGTIVYDGGISPSCGNESFSCTYDNVVIDFTNPNSGAEAMRAQCP